MPLLATPYGPTAPSAWPHPLTAALAPSPPRYPHVANSLDARDAPQPSFLIFYSSIDPASGKMWCPVRILPPVSTGTSGD